MPKILKEFQPILWSTNIENLDLRRDKIYIIHQVLAYGNLKQIKLLFRIYQPTEIREVFVKYPKKIYTPAIFHFIKNFILDLKNKDLSPQIYVKTFPRVIE